MRSLPKTVLLIEDSPSQAINVQWMLEQYGVQVLWAPNGQVGVLMAEEYQPDLIVMDVEMPVMNGFQACERLKEDPKTAEIPVVLLTVRNEPDCVLKGIELGVQDFIPKDPFSTIVLVSTLSQLGIIENLNEPNQKPEPAPSEPEAGPGEKRAGDHG